MTEKQALKEAMRRWGKAFPDRVFCCTEPKLMAGVFECPGDGHRAFSFTGNTWEEVFEAQDRAKANTLWWKLRAVNHRGQPIERVVDRAALADLDWDNGSDWTLRVKSTPRQSRRKRRSHTAPSDAADTTSSKATVVQSADPTTALLASDHRPGSGEPLTRRRRAAGP